MNYRFAAIDDCPLLGQLNFQLIHDEGHRNPMSPPELAARMERWLTSGEYKAVIFQKSGETVAYASFRQEDNQTIYLRQFFVHRERRCCGIGRQAISLLLNEILPKRARLTLEVLSVNPVGIEFWRSLGFISYAVVLEKLPERENPEAKSDYGSFH